MPLPPYIAGKRATDAADREDYQTMFAREDGAVAAPTAALHFTPALLAALDSAGIGRETLTLHVGAGTFLPVKADDTADHAMHAEWGRIDAATADRLNAARTRGGRLIAVGTTSLRLLEAPPARTARSARSTATPRSSSPRLRFRAIDGLMTNFHLPEIDAVHAGQRADGARTDAGGLCARDCAGVSVLQLRGCEPVAAAVIHTHASSRHPELVSGPISPRARSYQVETESLGWLAQASGWGAFDR
jgi:hypothetical protein